MYHVATSHQFSTQSIFRLWRFVMVVAVIFLGAFMVGSVTTGFAVPKAEAANFNLSGTLYTDAGVTPAASGKTIKVAISTSTPGIFSTTTDSGGDWTFNNISDSGVVATTTMTIWLDGDVSDASTVVSGYDTASISAVPLYYDYVIAKAATTTAVLNFSNFSAYDSSDDADIQFTAGTDNLTVINDQTFFIAATTTFNFDVTLYAHHFETATTATALASSTLYVTGDFTQNGSFIKNSTSSELWTVQSAVGNDDIWNSVIYGNGLFVAVSDRYSGGNTTIMTSPDAETWTARTGAGDNDWWEDLAYGNGIYVAVGQGIDRAMSSTNATTWTVRSTPGGNDSWRAVTYGNGIFVAVAGTGGNDRVMTSSNGTSWTARSAVGNNDDWNDVVYANGLFVAVGSSGDRVMTSSDGITWTARSAAGNNDSWNSITYGNGLFLAVSNGGDDFIMTSPDGITWTARSAAEDNLWNSVTYGSGLFVAVGQYGDRVITSPDGITWTARSAAGNDDSWNSITYGNGLFVAVGFYGDRVMTSMGGIKPLFFSGDIDQVISGDLIGSNELPQIYFYNSGSKTIIDNASTTNFYITSTTSDVTVLSSLTVSGTFNNDGVFTASTSTLYLDGDDQYLLGNLTGSSTLHNVVLSGAGYKIFIDNASTTDLTIAASSTMITPSELSVAGDYSNDGKVINRAGNWIRQTPAESNQWTSVTYGNGLFVAVSTDGTNRVMTSPDGITWTARSAAGVDDWWTSVTYGNGLFVAVGNSGDRVMTSPDGITWTARSAAGDDDWWNSVTYGSGLFVAVSNCFDSGNSCVMTSPDGITWTARSAAGDDDDWLSVTYGNGLFVAVVIDYNNPSGGLMMTSPDGITWTARSVAGDHDDWLSVTYGNGLFVAVGWTNQGDTVVITSSDGITWTAQYTYLLCTSSLTYGNGLFVSVGTNCVATAEDAATTFSGDSAQSISGNLTGESAFNKITITSSGVKNFSDNASTSDLVITSGATMVAPTILSITGDYQNTGTFTNNSGTVFLSGTKEQTISGTLVGASAFDDLTITNISQEGSTTQSIVFANVASTTGTFTMLASTSAAFPASATSTFQNISLQGGYGQYVSLRSSTPGTQYSFYVPGSQSTVTYVDVKDVVACPATITVYNGIDAGNNICWSFDSLLSITGNLYNDEGGVAVPNKTITVMLGTSTPSLQNSTTNSSGFWYMLVPDGHSIVASTPIIAWVDGDASTTAAVVTKAADGTADITGLDLYQDYVIARHEGAGTSTTNSDFSVYDNDDDVSIPFTSNAGSLNILAGNALYVWPGSTFSPEGDVYVHGNASTSTTDGLFVLNASSTYISSATTTIGGSLIALASSTINNTGVINFIATTTSKSISSQTQLGDVVFNNTEEIYFGASATTTDLTISAVSTVSIPHDLVVLGDYVNNGVVNYLAGGITWTARTAAEDNWWYSVTYGNGLFVAVGELDAGSNVVMTSPDGITWTARSAAGDDDSWTSVTYGNGLFVAVSYSGDRVMTSPDGITWTARTAAGDDDDWLSVTYGNGLFVAVGSSGDRVMTSPDGITWTARSAAGDDDSWNSVTYGNGLFVAVGSLGISDRVMTSPDGITWTARTAAEDNWWYSVTYGNGLFVAVGELDAGSNVVMTSPDGITWTARTAAGDDDGWYSVTYGNGLFVAVSADGTNRVMTSPDGITWTARSAAEDNWWYSVTYGNGLFVAVGELDAGSNVVMTSSAFNEVIFAGTSPQTLSGNLTATSTFNNITFTGAGTKTFSNNASTSDLTVATSSGEVILPPQVTVAGDYLNNSYLNAADSLLTLTGSSKTLTGTLTGSSTLGDVSIAGSYTANNNASTTNFTIASGGDFTAPSLLTIGGNFTQSGTFDNNAGTTYFTGPDPDVMGDLTSTNALGNIVIDPVGGGKSWVVQNVAGDDDTWYSVTYGNGLFVAVGAGADRVVTSPDGITWTARSAAGNDDTWASVTYGNGLFVAVGVGADRVMTSPDGITWTARSAAGNDDTWVSITYGNGLFVAVGFGADRVMTSPDGITWTARSAAGDNDAWYSVTYGNGLFVAVGQSGDRVMTSPDGITWTARSAAGNNDWWTSVTYGNGLFVAVSQFGDRVMTSPDGITRTAHWTSVTYGNGLFVAVGSLGISDRVMTSPDGITWTARSAAGDDDSWTSVTYGNGLFVAVGQSGDHVMTSLGTLTLTTASTTDFTVAANKTLLSTTSLTVAGDFTNNNGIMTEATEVIFSGTAVQTATGTMTGTNAFNDLTITNTSGTGATQSVVFGMPVQTTGTFTMVASTSAQFLAGATSTFQNVDWLGSSTTAPVWLRSSADGVQWYLDITGSRLNVDYVNVKDSNASSSANGVVYAFNSTDVGNNSNWDFDPTIGFSTLSNHDATQVNNNFTFQSVTEGSLFAFKLTPDSGNATVTDLVVSLVGVKNINAGDFSNLKLYRDHNNDAEYDAGDEQVGGAGIMEITGQYGSITFTADFLATTSQNFILIADWSVPANGAALTLRLPTSGLTMVDEVTNQIIYGSVDGVLHDRNKKGGSGGGSAAIGGDAPAGREVLGGGTNDGGEQIGEDTDFVWPTAHSGAWAGAAYAYDKVDGTYATTANAVSSNYTDHGFAVPGGNTVQGIAVKLEISGTTAAGDIGIELSYDGGTSWTTTKTTPTLTTTDAVVVVGGPSDTWGRSWAAGEFSNTNFLVRLTGNPSGNTVQVDAIQVRVYHQAGGGGSGGGSGGGAI